MRWLVARFGEKFPFTVLSLDGLGVDGLSSVTSIHTCVCFVLHFLFQNCTFRLQSGRDYISLNAFC